MFHSSHSCLVLLARSPKLAWEKSDFINEFVSGFSHLTQKSLGKIVFQVCYGLFKVILQNPENTGLSAFL